jgi:type II secretory pathway component GspD/PulD (secretin)
VSGTKHVSDCRVPRHMVVKPGQDIGRALRTPRPAILAALLVLAAGMPMAAQEGIQPRQRGSPGAAVEERIRATPDAQGQMDEEGMERGLPVPGGQPRLPAQPPTQTPVQPLTPPRPGANEVVLPDGALDLRLLIDYVAETLGINVAAADEVSGSVVINAPMTVRRDELLDMLDAFLEHQGFTIVPDRLTEWYRVVRMEGVNVRFEGERPTTRIISTPGIRPSSLAEIINMQMGGVAMAPGMAPRQARISYLDDLGVIVVTDTPRRINTLVELVNRVLDRAAEQQFLRFDLQHIAASVARQRVLDLIGQPGTTPIPGMPPGVQAGVPALGTGRMADLAERLTIDHQGNALILRGYPSEALRLERLLRVIDVPRQLEPRQYFAGAGVVQIAQMAERFGFGRVETLDAPVTTSPTSPMQFTIQQQGRVTTMQPQQQQTGAAGGGPVLVVDPVRGTIVYYGTPTQHAHLEALINIFEVEREVVEIRAYKLKHQPAVEVAELVQGMVSGAQPLGRTPFLPGGTGAGTLQQLQRQFGAPAAPGIQQRGTPAPTTPRRPGTRGSADDQAEYDLHLAAMQQVLQGTPAVRPGQPGIGSLLEGVLGGEDVFILPDRANNQIIIKAPARQQEEFERLIEKLDQRRPQVFIEVQIVAVTATDDFRLAFETQLINAGGREGAFSTNFGLSSVPQSGDITDRKIVPPLAGFTGALIRTNHVPIIINTLKREADTRILSSPQLLVDDNESATIVSVEQQPTLQTSLGVTGELQSFTYEDAGTQLSVTPSISDGGYLRLTYDITLSNFFGTAPAPGAPPPRQDRTISSSVTIPGDTTIVVGGITVDSSNKTVLKVPLIGDIPLVGHLFRDTNKADSNTRLYVFITPRILRDPNFRDLILLTRGPQAEAGITVEMPPLEPVMIEMIQPVEPRRPWPLGPATPAPDRQQPGRLEEPTEY